MKSINTIYSKVESICIRKQKRFEFDRIGEMMFYMNRHVQGIHNYRPMQHSTMSRRFADSI